MSGVFIEESVLIQAKPQVVWLVLSEIARWPNWNPICTGTTVMTDDVWNVGGRFQMVLATDKEILRLNSTVIRSEQGKRILWKSGRKGLIGEFEFVIEPDDGRTRVIARQSFKGILYPLLRLTLSPQEVEKLIRVWLDSLKRESERRARELREVV